MIFKRAIVVEQQQILINGIQLKIQIEVQTATVIWLLQDENTYWVKDRKWYLETWMSTSGKMKGDSSLCFLKNQFQMDQRVQC